jgi:hypothetical protein
MWITLELCTMITLTEEIRRSTDEYLQPVSSFRLLYDWQRLNWAFCQANEQNKERSTLQYLPFSLQPKGIEEAAVHQLVLVANTIKAKSKLLPIRPIRTLTHMITFLN